MADWCPTTLTIYTTEEVARRFSNHWKRLEGKEVYLVDRLNRQTGHEWMQGVFESFFNNTPYPHRIEDYGLRTFIESCTVDQTCITIVVRGAWNTLMEDPDDGFMAWVVERWHELDPETTFDAEASTYHSF